MKTPVILKVPSLGLAHRYRTTVTGLKTNHMLLLSEIQMFLSNLCYAAHKDSSYPPVFQSKESVPIQQKGHLNGILAL